MVLVFGDVLDLYDCEVKVLFCLIGWYVVLCVVIVVLEIWYGVE